MTHSKAREPEDVRQSLESCRAKLELYEKAMAGDIEALMKCSLERGMITKSIYEEVLAVKDRDETYD